MSGDSRESAPHGGSCRRRTIALGLSAITALAPLAVSAQAPTYPVKPVRLVVPLAPGGGADTLGRYVARQLTDGLGQQVIVENRPGGGGVVGGEYVARAAPDGYTLLVGGTGQIVGSLTHRRIDMLRDSSPLEYAPTPESWRRQSAMRA